MIYLIADMAEQHYMKYLVGPFQDESDVETFKESIPALREATYKRIRLYPALTVKGEVGWEPDQFDEEGGCISEFVDFASVVEPILGICLKGEYHETDKRMKSEEEQLSEILYYEGLIKSKQIPEEEGNKAIDAIQKDIEKDKKNKKLAKELYDLYQDMGLFERVKA